MLYPITLVAELEVVFLIPTLATMLNFVVLFPVQTYIPKNQLSVILKSLYFTQMAHDVVSTFI